MQISVIIVSYNVKLFLEQCLHSVFDAARFGHIEVEVFVVDNASEDATVGYIQTRFPAKEYPSLHLIANARNVGFSRANNQAVARAKGDYILFINPDTLLGENTLADCLDFAVRHENLGALGVKMLHDNGKFALESRRGVPTPWTSFCKISGLTALFPKSRRFGRYYMQYLDVAKPAAIEIVSGAFMLIPRKVIQDCGSFDETFFMYGEDVDMSYRFLLSGKQNYYLPTPIIHYKGESTHKNSYRYVHVFYNAMLIFFQKHFGHYSLLFSIPIKLTILFRAILALIAAQIRSVTPQKVNRDKYLYIGQRVNFPAIQALADKWQLEIDCREGDAQTLPQGHLEFTDDLKPYLYVVYDRAAYPASHILQLMQQPANRHYIGLFDPRTHVLTTGGGSYQP